MFGSDFYDFSRLASTSMPAGVFRCKNQGPTPAQVRAKVANVMSRKGYEEDWFLCVGDQIIEDLVGAADGEAIVGGPGPDDLCEGWFVAG